MNKKLLTVGRAALWITFGAMMAHVLYLMWRYG